LKKAVAMRSTGIQLIAPGSGGVCDATKKRSVEFGIDTLSACSVSLTTDQLAALCNSGFPTILNATSDFIGIYGNADPLILSDWMEISAVLPVNSPRWDPTRRTCFDIVTSLHYEFLVAKVGTVGNLQSKFVSARYRFGTSAWGMVGAANVATLTQTFTYKSTATFIYLPDGAKEEYVPPSPKVIPPLPNDLLYPFKFPGSPASGIHHASLTLSKICVIGTYVLIGIICFYH
jgi:hypothetical protein